MSKQLAKAQHPEDGFTLIEMIIAVVITTMITGALAAVFVTSGRSTSASSHRSNQTNDAQVISSFLVKDAQAAGAVDPLTGINDSTAGAFTNAAATCSVTGTVLRFRWVDRSSTATYVDAVYTRSGTKLTRTVCNTPVAGGTTTTLPSISLASNHRRGLGELHDRCRDRCLQRRQQRPAADARLGAPLD